MTNVVVTTTGLSYTYCKHQTGTETNKRLPDDINTLEALFQDLKVSLRYDMNVHSEYKHNAAICVCWVFKYPYVYSSFKWAWPKG